MSGYSTEDVRVTDVDSNGEDEQLQVGVPVPRASLSLELTGQDGALKDASQVLVRDLGQVGLSSTLQKADALFTSIMDPNNEDTRRLVKDLFYEPMKAINDKAIQAINAIDVNDPGKGSEQIALVGEILEASAKVRETTLDHVYDNMDRQINHFSSSVDAYNTKMKETVVQALELYQQRIDTEIEVRTKVLKQKKEECAAMLEVSMQETEVRVANMRLESGAQLEQSQAKLDLQRKKDQREHDKELKSLERAEKKAEQELDKQRKKDEQEHKKAEADFERLKKKDDAEHAKLVKELERRASNNRIDQEERELVMQELKVEMERYNQEFALAREAMRSAIGKWWKGCEIAHTAPKIEWSKPPRVIPGSVSWSLR